MILFYIFQLFRKIFVLHSLNKKYSFNLSKVNKCMVVKNNIKMETLLCSDCAFKSLGTDHHGVYCSRRAMCWS